MNGRLCGFDIKLILVLNIKNGANHTMQIYTQYMNIICSYHNIQYLAANFASNFIVSEKSLQLVDALWLPTPNYTITSLRFEISWLWWRRLSFLNSHLCLELEKFPSLAMQLVVYNLC